MWDLSSLPSHERQHDLISGKVTRHWDVEIEGPRGGMAFLASPALDCPGEFTRVTPIWQRHPTEPGRSGAHQMEPRPVMMDIMSSLYRRVIIIPGVKESRKDGRGGKEVSYDIFDVPARHIPAVRSGEADHMSHRLCGKGDLVRMMIITVLASAESASALLYPDSLAASLEGCILIISQFL